MHAYLHMEAGYPPKFPPYVILLSMHTVHHMNRFGAHDGPHRLGCQMYLTVPCPSGGTDVLYLKQQANHIVLRIP